MNENIKNLGLQELINNTPKEEGFDFSCPNCGIKINEALFGRDGQNFRLFINKCKEVAKEQWLKELIENKKYEDIQEVIKKTNAIEDLKKSVEGKDRIIEELKVQISGVYSSDKVENLARVKDLKKEIEENNKQIEELKENSQPEIKLLKQTIEDLKVNLAKIQSSEEVEKLDRVKDLKEKVENYQKENEKLKLGSQPEIENLKLSIKNLEKELAETKVNSEKQLAKATSADAVNELKVVQELKEERDKYQKESKDLREQNHQLTLLSQKKLSGQELEQDFFGELTKVFADRDKIIDIRGEVGKKADFLQEVLTEKDKSAGRIVYETKNTKDWDNKWIEKLEKDMQKHQADFGFVIATCINNSKTVEQIDPQKKIYIVGYNNNLFMVARIMRDVLITKHNFKEMDNSTDKEQKLRKIEEWINDKLPRYISSLEGQLENQANYAEAIIGKAKKIKEFKEEIQKLVMNNIVLEIKTLLS